jgi:hypothetical protein
VILDDPVFLALSAPHFDLAIGRPFTPIKRYLRLMFEVPLLALVQCHLAKVDHGLVEVLASGVLPAQPPPGRHDRRLWHRLGWWLAAV